MNSKMFSFVLLTAILLSLSLVSAQISLSTPDALSKAKNTTVLTITNLASSNSTYNITIQTPINISDGQGNAVSISLSQSTITNLVNGSSANVNLYYTSLPSSFTFGTFSTTVFASVVGNSSINSSATLSFVNSFCDYGDAPSNATWLEIVRVDDETLDNEDEWDWAPLDDIEVSVKISNRYNSDLDVTVEYGLYNPGTRQFIDLDEDTIDVSIDDGKSKEVTIAFRVPADIDARSDYRFYVKAYKEGSEAVICADKEGADYYQPVEISKESNAVILDDFSMDSSAFCGEEVELNAKAYNTGKDDEDNVLITFYNKELGVNMKQVMENLDEGDSDSVRFSFTVPTNATEKTYSFELKTYFKYDDDNSGCSVEEDVACYDKDSLDDLEKTFKVSLNVAGNCIKPVNTTDKVDITASLESKEAVAGKGLVIKANIKNSGTASQTYNVLVSGIETFALLQKIEPQSFTLDAGQSKDILITLKADDDAEGDYTFNIKTVYGSKTKEQPVSLTIQAKSGIFNSLSNAFSGNWFIWLIVAVNVLLIVIIIIALVRIAKK